MKTLTTLLLAATCGTAFAQTTITNGGFENWGNASPGVSSEPTGWYSNKSGSSTATLGPQTCFQDNTVVHSGTYSVRVENATVPVFGTVVNGNVTTGVVNAPTTTKTDGYIGTVNYSTSTDDRRMAFTGRPDSLVGWYQYTAGAAGEQGKIRAILHTGDYYDPETPTTYHPDPTANKIADVTFLTPTSSVSAWTRFSVPFTYVSAGTPAYIMINVTSSANQATTVATSKLWLDDLQVVYKPGTPTAVSSVASATDGTTVYGYQKRVCVRFDAAKHADCVLKLYDVSGRQVFSANIDNGAFFAFRVPELIDGIYIYELSDNSTGTRVHGRIAL